MESDGGIADANRRWIASGDGRSVCGILAGDLSLRRVSRGRPFCLPGIPSSR